MPLSPDLSRLLTTEEALREEASVILGAETGEVSTKEERGAFYRALCSYNYAALCLSGGGIRSAAFSLGVVQALAIHPRDRDGSPAKAAQESLLTEFHYMSTVSGGGYLGSWLSAWRTRSDLPTVWRGLVGRPDGFDRESSPIAWLRSYSNYLTPKLGLFSADSWALISIYIRNLALNWLLILPFLCTAILAMKLFVFFAVASTQADEPNRYKGLLELFWEHPELRYAFVELGVGVTALIVALAFITHHRPSRRPPVATAAGSAAPSILPEVDAGASQGKFLRIYMLLLLFSAGCFALAASTNTIGALFQPKPGNVEHPLTGWYVPSWSMLDISIWAAALGAAIYATGWLAGSPKIRGLRDFLAWAASGAIFGALLGIGYHLVLQIPETIPGSEGSLIVAVLNSMIMPLLIGVPWFLFAIWCAETFFVGITSFQPGFNADQEWLGRSGGWVILFNLCWVSLTFLIFAGFLTKVNSPSASALYSFMMNWFIPIGIGSGLIVAIAGSGNLSGLRFETTGMWSQLRSVLLAIAGPLFLAALIFGLSIMLDWLILGHLLFEDPNILRLINEPGDEARNYNETLGWLAVALIISLVTGLVLSKRININRISLHSLYRNRLIRAFLGASNPRRIANPFSGFDAGDNLQMSQLWPELQQPPPKKITREDWRPFQIINLTLNIVASNDLAWQERKAASFTMSPLHCGSGSLKNADARRVMATRNGAYRDSARYGNARRGVCLGTAMAISGAAANPNMGYHSSPAITFLMTMLNVRLGWWLGNPAQQTYSDSGPRSAIFPLLAETLGLTTDSKPYIHLSDGGHFDNLGLYEMVRRRCKFILVCDAGHDPDYSFADLGNAVRKIEIDLGIRIRFHDLEKLKQRSMSDRTLGPDVAYHAVGEIEYTSVDSDSGENGIVVFVKAGYHGNEGASIVSYALAHPDFPHQSTANQWFTESQFEAYRALGFEITDRILTNAAHKNETYRRAPSIKTLFHALLVDAKMVSPKTAGAKTADTKTAGAKTSVAGNKRR